MLDARKLFWYTLVISLLLETYVRYVSVKLSGVSTFISWPPVDNVMHFFWGATIFLFFVGYLRWHPKHALLAVIVWQLAW